MTGSGPALEELAARLEQSGSYRVLRSFAPPSSYGAPDGTAVGKAVALDVETTGFDTAGDAIIELSMVPFTYSRDNGRIFDVSAPLTWLEDPGRPIPREITELTGITDADVAGKRIDEGAARAALAGKPLVIAHNAGFDRPFVERRLGAFREVPWACSMDEVPWRSTGVSSKSLEYLLIKRCGLFYGAHRADNDTRALIHLLATPLPDGRLPMALLLESARKGTRRIWAEGAPIETKDLLKARRYRWNPGTDGRPRAWWKEVGEGDAEAELEWLRQQVFGGERRKLPIDKLDAFSRYSGRG